MFIYIYIRCKFMMCYACFFLEPMWTSWCRWSIPHGASLARTRDTPIARPLAPPKRSFRKGLFGNSFWTSACRLCHWSSRWCTLQQTHIADIAIESWWMVWRCVFGFLLSMTNCQPYPAINFSSMLMPTRCHLTPHQCGSSRTTGPTTV